MKKIRVKEIVLCGVSMALSLTANAKIVDDISGYAKHSRYASELRLLPEGCYKTNTEDSTRAWCDDEWLKVKKRMLICEVENEGVLIRDDARRILLCVKSRLKKQLPV